MGAAKSSPAFFPVAGDLINGKYAIERMLGRGGMGAVFAAHNRLTGRRVALKWVLPERATPGTRARLLREARTTSAVNHPNVVQVFDVCEHHGGLFLVMECLEGEPLADWMERRGPCDPIELLGVLMPVLRGVQACHDAGVIHRDLKPDNILLCSQPSGEVLPKVLDFGVSKTFDRAPRPSTSLTQSGALIGTPHFMALEQVDGSGDIDARTDVYALGVILYLGLTGEPPFDGDSLGELILQIGTRKARPLRRLRPHLPAALDRVIRKAIARNRVERFSSVRELGLALEPFAGGVRFDRSLIDTTAGSTQPRASLGLAGSTSPPARRGLRWATWLAAALALGGAGWLTLHETHPPAGAHPRAETAAARPSAASPEAIDTRPNAQPPRNARADRILVIPDPPDAPDAPPTGEDPGPPAVAPDESETPAGAPPPATHAAKREHRRPWTPPHADPVTPRAERIRGQRTPGLSADDF